MATDYKSIASKIKFEGRAFIDGKYVDAIDGEKFENINPATNEKLCTVSKCNHKEASNCWYGRQKNHCDAIAFGYGSSKK